MRVDELLAILERLAPLALSEPWDRSGLQLGDPKAQIDRVAFAMDATPESVERALDACCQALVTHHPLFFIDQQNMILTRFIPKVAASALKGNLVVIGWHTAWDSGCGGVNEGLLSRADLEERTALKHADNERGFGLGGIGRWRYPLMLDAAAARLAEAWGLSGYRLLARDGRVSVCRVALCGGSGGDMWLDAHKAGAQLYATAEMKHHQILEALGAGLALMICDHGEMEEPSMADLARQVGNAGVETCFLPAERISLNHWCDATGRAISRPKAEWGKTR